ncbi:sulfurtransferase [Nesterenkonia aurantiaca]|uniref:Thiosulfate/3-mercaptopyruvate sulfurtransferase n=1 Tax=Nesterenkonia aurantiaca TaxID=1436010 RepID=A0A4R7FW86_9MICC|nr:sulfurtransferase [Nesterenkonia aurantiaca]TDS83043.1 thiosulfate/3-mercaptopyruvate sulfurtransferase [Nesterenkonia aurantiaca]
MTGVPTLPEVSITVEELRALQRTGAPLTLLDVRWRQDRPEGLPEYLAGHIPGAVFVDLEYELSAPDRPAGDGAHPLPDPAAFQESVRRWGIGPEDTVVVYDDLKNFSSARAWWLLRHAGLADVRVLDGSLRAWVQAGHALAEGFELPVATEAEIRFGAMKTADLDEIAALGSEAQLIDARSAQRYAGDGRIPGALNAPVAGNVDDHGRLLPAAQLQQCYLELGVKPGVPVYCYCASGVHSAYAVLALSAAGFDPVLFPGGFGQWVHGGDHTVHPTLRT